MKRPIFLPIIALILLLGLILGVVLYVNIVQEEKQVERLAQEAGLPRESIAEIIKEARYEVIITIIIMFLFGVIGIALIIVYQHLRLSRKRLYQTQVYNDYILHSITRGVLSFDLAGRLTSINRSARELLQLKENFLTKNYEQFLPDVLAPLISETLVSLRPMEDKEIEYEANSGKTLSLQVTTAVLKDDAEKPMGAVMLLMDRTEIKQLQASVRRADTLAALGRLAASLAHEIRNPLSGISINLQLLQESVDILNAPEKGELREYAEIIDFEIKRLEGLVQNFIQFARPPQLNLKKVNINAVLKHVLELFSGEAQEQGVAIIRELEDNLPQIKADSEKLHQAFLNLVINALQVMPEGGNLIVRTYLVEKEGKLKVEIEDTGCGIDKEEMDKLFEFFYSTKPDGAGMGLPIAHQIISDHGGDIDVLSQPQEGTIFIISLPIDGKKGSHKEQEVKSYGRFEQQNLDS